MAIPTRILEQINNSELDAKDFYSLYGKENIETALDGLKKSDEEIFNIVNTVIAANNSRVRK